MCCFCCGYVAVSLPVIPAKPRCYRQLSTAHEETEAQRGAATGLRSHSQEVVELGFKPRLYHSTQYAHLDMHVPARTHKHVWAQGTCAHINAHKHNTFTHMAHIYTYGHNPGMHTSPTDSRKCTHTHIHGVAQMCTHARTQTHLLMTRNCSAHLALWSGARTPSLRPQEHRLPSAPPSRPPPDVCRAPASQPDVLNAPGCLRDPQAGGVARLPPDVSMTPRPAPGREEPDARKGPEAPQGSQALLRQEEQAGAASYAPSWSPKA